MCRLFNFHSASATGGKKAAIDRGSAKGQQQVVAKENATNQHKKGNNNAETINQPAVAKAASATWWQEATGSNKECSNQPRRHITR